MAGFGTRCLNTENLKIGFKELVKNGATVGTKTFSDVARYRLLDLLEFIVENGTDVNQVYKLYGSSGVTPLMDAAYESVDDNPNGDYFDSKHIDAIEILKFLLNNGADVNAKDSDGKTALDWAAKPKYKKPGRLEEVTTLLEENSAK